jgi:hypothetical protein
MAKRRRKPPKQQARATEREWWQQQQASAKRLTESPFFRSLQEANRQLRDSPHGRRMIKDARRLREWHDLNLRATPPEAAAPSTKRPHRGGKGRKPSLDNDTIMALRQTYGRALQHDPTLAKYEAAIETLRPKLPKKHRGIHGRTIVRLIVKPVLDARTK